MTDLNTFSPALLRFWEKAAAGVAIEVPVPSRRFAFNMRHRLYTVRKAMLEAKHPLSENIAKCTIRVRDRNYGSIGVEPEWTLVCGLSDLKFEEVLADAGVVEGTAEPSLGELDINTGGDTNGPQQANEVETPSDPGEGQGDIPVTPRPKGPE
jgi:hypothetical protein